jgi:hypothetical protein
LLSFVILVIASLPLSSINGIAKTLQIRKAMDDRIEEQFRPYIDEEEE